MICSNFVMILHQSHDMLLVFVVTKIELILYDIII